MNPDSTQRCCNENTNPPQQQRRFVLNICSLTRGWSRAGLWTNLTSSSWAGCRWRRLFITPEFHGQLFSGGKSLLSPCLFHWWRQSSDPRSNIRQNWHAGTVRLLKTWLCLPTKAPSLLKCLLSCKVSSQQIIFGLIKVASAKARRGLFVWRSYTTA